MPILYVYDNEHYDALKERQQCPDKHDTHKYLTITHLGSSIVVQRGGTQYKGGTWYQEA